MRGLPHMVVERALRARSPVCMISIITLVMPSKDKYLVVPIDIITHRKSAIVRQRLEYQAV